MASKVLTGETFPLKNSYAEKIFRQIVADEGCPLRAGKAFVRNGEM